MIVVVDIVVVLVSVAVVEERVLLVTVPVVVDTVVLVPVAVVDEMVVLVVERVVVSLHRSQTNGQLIATIRCKQSAAPQLAHATRSLTVLHSTVGVSQ